MDRPITFYSPELGRHMRITIDVKVDVTHEPGMVEVRIPEVNMKTLAEWTRPELNLVNVGNR